MGLSDKQYGINIAFRWICVSIGRQCRHYVMKIDVRFIILRWLRYRVQEPNILESWTEFAFAAIFNCIDFTWIQSINSLMDWPCTQSHAFHVIAMQRLFYSSIQSRCSQSLSLHHKYSVVIQASNNEWRSNDKWKWLVDWNGTLFDDGMGECVWKADSCICAPSPPP